jgi:excisionase family DNA binding protein
VAITTGVWLTVEEAAGPAKVSEWTLYRACELGELRHVRIGGRRVIRLSRDAVDEWMLRYERPSAAGAPSTTVTTVRR